MECREHGGDFRVAQLGRSLVPFDSIYNYQSH